MARVMWNGHVLAESDDYQLVEGNVYSPPDNVRKELSRSNDATTICGRKGQAHHYGVVVDGEANPGAARYYPTPKQAAEHIKDHFAFWRGISVER